MYKIQALKLSSYVRRSIIIWRIDLHTDYYLCRRAKLAFSRNLKFRGNEQVAVLPFGVRPGRRKVADVLQAWCGHGKGWKDYIDGL